MSNLTQARKDLDQKLSSMGYVHPEKPRVWGADKYTVINLKDEKGVYRATGNASIPYASFSDKPEPPQSSPERVIPPVNPGNNNIDPDMEHAVWNDVSPGGPYTHITEECPVCHDPPVGQCECEEYGEMECKNSHMWWVNGHGEIMVGDPHEGEE